MRRFTQTQAQTLADHLHVTHIRDSPRPVLFLGAGCSMSAGFPGEKNLLETATERFGKPFRTPDELRDLPPRQLRDFLAHIIGTTDTGTPHAILATLVMAGYFDIICTTNWDNAIERSLADVAAAESYAVYTRPVMPDSSIAEALRQTRPRVKILKLHGDVTSEQIITDDKLLRFENSLETTLKDLFQHRGVIFVGYSFAEPRIIQFGELPNLWIVDPSAHEIDPRTLSTMGAKPPTVISDSDADFRCFMEGLAEALLTRRHRRAYHLTDSLEQLPPTATGEARELVERMITEFYDHFRTTVVDDSRAETMIHDLLGQVRRHFSYRIHQDPGSVCMVFVNDPSQPGGSEILERIQSDQALAQLCDGFTLATVTVSGRTDAGTESAVTDHKELPGSEPRNRGWRHATGWAPLAGDDYVPSSIIILDDIAFTGRTVQLVCNYVTSLFDALASGDCAAALLLVGHDARRELRDLGWQVFAADTLPPATYEVTFPWGWTRATGATEAGADALSGLLPGSAFGYTPKPWGYVASIPRSSREGVRVLFFERAQRTSVHYHLLRGEVFVPLDDVIRVRIWDRYVDLRRHQALRIPPGLVHQLIALDEPCRVLEISHGPYLEDEDIVRLIDAYGRVANG